MRSDSVRQGDGPDGSVNGAGSRYQKKTDYVKLGLACANICGALVPLGLNSEQNTNVKKQLTQATFKLFLTTFVRNSDVIGLKMLIFRNGSASCQKFVRFYLFSHFELFSSHEHSSSFLLTHVLTFAMISPHVLFPLFYFAFTIHTKSEPLRTQRSRFEDLSKEQELSTREVLRQAPSPTRSRIARLRR